MTCGDAQLRSDFRRPARSHGLCGGHEGRWRGYGRPALAQFAAATPPGFAQASLLHCQVPGCGYGVAAMGLCNRHARQWIKAGRPALDGWLAAVPPARVPRGSARYPAAPSGRSPRAGCAVSISVSGSGTAAPAPDGWLALFGHHQPGLPPMSTSTCAPCRRR